MTSGTWHRFGSAFLSDLLSSNANLVRGGKKEDPTCPLCNGRQTTEHVSSSCKVALSQGRYTWRHNRVLQELAVVILLMSMAKGQSTHLEADAVIFTTEGGAKSWHRRAVKLTKPEEISTSREWQLESFSRSSRLGQPPQYMYNQRDKIKARHRYPFILHTGTHDGKVNSSIWKQNGRAPHLQKREIPEPDQSARRCRLQSCCNARWGWCQRVHRICLSSVYDLLAKVSICGNKRTKTLKLQVEIAENSFL